MRSNRPKPTQNWDSIDMIPDKYSRLLEFWIQSPGAPIREPQLWKPADVGSAWAWLAATPIFGMQGSPARPWLTQNRVLKAKRSRSTNCLEHPLFVHYHCHSLH